jgi:hypothetical protein
MVLVVAKRLCVSIPSLADGYHPVNSVSQFTTSLPEKQMVEQKRIQKPMVGSL